MFAAKNELLTRPSGGYRVTNSLRFRSSASAYLSRTFTTPTDNKKWTYSVWIKKAKIATGQAIMSSNVDGAEYWDMSFNTSDQIAIQNRVGSSNLLLATTTAVFRDPSAWYHIVFVFDSANATAAFRNRLYVNGVEYAFSSNSGSSNASAWNVSGVQHNIGVSRTLSTSGTIWLQFDGYETEINFIDGQALTPLSFGAYDTNGVWQPAACTVSDYGKNGFYLPFSDSANIFNDKAAIATNHSAANNWTANSLQTTSSTLTTYDYMIDSPTNYADGGNGRGNYATWNPLTTTAGTFTNANLRYVGPSSWRRVNGTISVSSGKWYYEFTFTGSPYSPRGSTTAYTSFGFGLVNVFNSTTGTASLTDALTFSDNGYYKNFSGASTDSGVAITSGDVFAIAVDLSANTYNFYQNNVSRASGTIGVSAGTEIVPIILSYDNSYTISDVNFGQRPFAYTPPSGFLALNTQNLPTPTIANGAQYMAATKYDGTSSSNSISNATNNTLGTTFQPDFVWIKNRNYASGTNHVLIDSIRGASLGLASNLTNADFSTTGNFSSINNNGFTVAGTTRDYNLLNDTFVGWQWKAANATTTGYQPSGATISCSYNANASAGFSIVKYVGNGTNNSTIGHGLGAAPSLIIIKRTDGANAWDIYHVSNGAQKYMDFTASGVGSSSTIFSTVPTSSLFYIGSTGGQNTLNGNFVAYLWAPVSGFSSFGQYSGNSSTDGSYIYLGFRPRWLLIKGIGSGGSGWMLLDTSRDTYNVSTSVLRPDLAAAESTGYGNVVDILSNGFKLRSTDTNSNSSSTTYGPYIYAAFAENPFKISRAR